MLVTSLDLEVRSLAQLYRDRADSENLFDELKNQWGWAGFTTRDLDRSQHMAPVDRAGLQLVDAVRPVSPIPTITARRSPAGRCCCTGWPDRPATPGQTRLTVTSSHGRRDRVAQALRAITAFFADLWQTAEQLTDAERWSRILSHALRKYLHGRQLRSPPWLNPSAPTPKG